MHESEIREAIVCLIIALLVGGVVWVAGTYLFRVAWAGAAGFLAFLIVLALCLL